MTRSTRDRRATDAVTVRRAETSEWRLIETFYRERKYQDALSSDAIVIVAERRGRLIGVGRVQLEQGVFVLRGMRVDPPFQRRGIGARMLTQLLAEVSGHTCYCIAYRHLCAFYGRAGFAEVDPDAAPAFLRDRAAGYRASGLDVTVLRT